MLNMQTVSDRQLEALLVDARDTWLRLISEKKRRVESKKLDTVLACGECRTNGMCPTHKTMVFGL